MSVLSPVLQPILQPVLSSLTRAALPGSGLSAFSAAKYAIQQGAVDVNILVVGDSTGDATTEWVYLFGQWLGGQHPTHSVSYRVWNSSTLVYDPAISLGTGSGSRTIRIWNASVSGSRPTSWTGDWFPAIAGSNADIVLWSHGHNIYLSNAEPRLIRGDFLACMEPARQALPTAIHAMVIQNAHRDDTLTETLVAPVIRAICNDRGDTGVIDVCAAFLAAGKTPSLYLDNIHPNAAGEALWAQTVARYWQNSGPASRSTKPSWLDGIATNYIASARPVAANGSLNPGWAINGAGVTVAADTTVVDAGSTYSCKLTKPLGTFGLRCTVNSATTAPLRGKTVTMLVRMFIPEGNDTASGRIGISSTPAGTSLNWPSPVTGQGGWRWQVLPGHVVPDENNSALRIDVDQSSVTPSGTVTYIDRVILVEGTIPIDAVATT